ncbi:MAG: AIR synthase-related protein [Mangrovibacterium sp.]
MNNQMKPQERFSIDQIEEPKDIKAVIAQLMNNPNISPANYFNDFSSDEMAGDDGETAGFGIYVSDDGSMVSMTTHAYHRSLSKDPELSAEILISKAFRRMVCFGARPKVMSAFLYHVDVSDEAGKEIAVGAKRGIDKCAQLFGVKVADRKIRFDHFKETGKPTLIITAVGKIEETSKLLTHKFKQKGSNLFVIGESKNDINASEYLQFYHRVQNEDFPIFDLNQEEQFHRIMPELIAQDLISSAIPVGRGGLFFSLIRAAIPAKLGFDITTDVEIRSDAFLFGESMGRLIVGVPDDKVVDFVDYMQTTDMSFFTLGHTTKGEIRIDDESYGFISPHQLPLE